LTINGLVSQVVPGTSGGYIGSLMQPLLANGSTCRYAIGATNSAANCGFMSFFNNGPGNTTNTFGIGMNNAGFAQG
jgi:hypothetical protein